LTRDKGVLDLAGAFRIIADERHDVRLAFVGPDEDGLQPAIAARCAGLHDRVRFHEFTHAPQEFMAAADVLCLPSYREGVGTVAIEAAACAVPVVASRIYGIVDAVDEGRTGLLHAAGDVQGLARELRRLIDDPPLRQSLGSAGRVRAGLEFDVTHMVAGQLAIYAGALGGASVRSARRWYRRFGKRALDLVIASVALIAALPLLVAVAAVVRLTLGARVLFRQRRPGLKGVPFTLMKFRSMSDRYDRHGSPLPDADRLSPFGRFLRATSLDELPELWNVVRGEMSLVGPRPLRMEYLDRYTDEQARRHDLLP